LGTAVHWHARLFVLALAAGSSSIAASADQAYEQSTPNGGATPSSASRPQPSGESDNALPIIITGSRIPRTDLTAVSPVTMVDGHEFKLQGATNVEEALKQLPQVNPSQDVLAPPGATGAATIDLRGLGAVRTLVLVNGHRLVPGDPRYPVPDVNIIPTSIVRRVEVLTGGAAAVYGSDAVAGVVNFILDTNIDGIRLDAQIGAYQHSNRDKFAQGLLDQRQFPYPKGSVLDGRRESVSVAFGKSFFDDRAHVTLYGGYRKIAGVMQDRRDYGACPLTAKMTGQQLTPVLECGGPVVSYPGNFFDNLLNIYTVAPDRTFVPGLSRFNYAPWHYIQRPDKRYTAGGFATFEFSRAVQAYAEVMAMKDRTVWQVGPSGDFRDTDSINCDNPLLSDQQRSLICRTGNFIGEIPVFDGNGNLATIVGSPTPFADPATGKTFNRAHLLISLRNIESESIQDDLRHKSIRLLGGFKGDLGRGVRYDASYLSSRVSLNRQYRNNFSIARLGRALDVVSDPSNGQPVCRSALIARELGPSAPDADANCVPWDIFAPGQVTPQSIAYLSIPPSMHGSFRERVGNVNATVDLSRWGVRSPWSDEASAINVGAEYRRDAVDFDPDAFTEAGDVAGFGEPVFPIDGSISTKEVFGEARVPLLTNRPVRRLAFEGGFRKSWYSNARSSFTSDAYKLALDLTAVSGLRLRASQQRANRAPNILELFAPTEADAFNRDPCAGISPLASEEACALTGVAPGQYGHVPEATTNLFEYSAIMGGNEGLQPETATTRTIGIVLQPRILRGFNATIDWWDIRLKGAISKIGAQAIVDSCIASGDPIFCSRIHRDPNGSLLKGDGHVDNSLANLGALKVRGIDGSADFSLLLGRLGSANLGFRGTYVLRWVIDNGGLSRPYDCAGLFGAPCGMQPRWRHTARATWDPFRPVSLSVQWRHMGGAKLAALDPKFNLTDQVSPGHATLRAQDYFDIATVFTVRKDLELRLGVNNLLDRQPPLVIGNTAAGDGPYNSNTYPTWYDPLGRYIFASVSVDLKT